MTEQLGKYEVHYATFPTGQYERAFVTGVTIIPPLSKEGTLGVIGALTLRRSFNNASGQLAVNAFETQGNHETTTLLVKHHVPDTQQNGATPEEIALGVAQAIDPNGLRPIDIIRHEPRTLNQH